MPTAPATALQDLLKVLSDPTRLRILALLGLEELSVGELSRSLGMAQSRVSNHLRLLREQRLLRERHVGSSTFLKADLAGDKVDLAGDEGERNGHHAPPLAARLWGALAGELATLPEHPSDVERLHRVLAERLASSADFFDRVAGDWDKIGVDFATGQGRQRVAANLLPAGLVVADLGCGTGYLSRALLGLCRRLICVDRSQGMLEEARRRLEPAPPGTAIELRAGELESLPLADDEVDGAVAGMVLHHLPDPSRALAEMYRAIRPGGTAVVLELSPHREGWMHASLGDRHLGLDEKDVVVAMERCGFEDVRLESVDDRYRPKLPPEEQPGTEATEATDAAAPREADLSLYLVRGRVPSAG